MPPRNHQRFCARMTRVLKRMRANAQMKPMSRKTSGRLPSARSVAAMSGVDGISPVSIGASAHRNPARAGGRRVAARRTLRAAVTPRR